MNELVRSALLCWRSLFAVVALASTWLAMLLFGAGPLDRSIYEGLYAGHKPAKLEVARVLTFLGEPTVLVGAGFVVAAWIWWRRSGRAALTLLFVILIGRGLSELQKIWIDRPRPNIEQHLVGVKTSSFPSGHATSSMIFYLTLALALTTDLRGRRIAVAGAVLLSLLIGTSRVMLGVHWPSDVIGGWSFGMLWVVVTRRISERPFRSGRPNFVNESA
jgi:membrane-associated phospholipid phosphatase